MAKSRGKIYLVGPVRMPGPQDIPSDEVFTLSKAILRAGDFTDFADKHNVKVTRKTDSDLTLEPGDLIYVPERMIRF